MDQTTLHRRACVVAAKRVLGLMRLDDVASLAEDALSAGVYTDAIREMAVDISSTSDDAAAVEARVFRDLGVPLLSRDDAVRCLIHDSIRQMLADEMAPAALALEVHAIVSMYLQDDPTGRAIGSEALVALGFDCLRMNLELASDEEVRRLGAPLAGDIRDEAVKWLARHTRATNLF